MTSIVIIFRQPAAIVAAVLFAMPAAQAEQKVAPTQVQSVQLPAPGASRQFKGVIRGNASAGYVFQAPAGRRLQIELKTTHASNYFNVVQEGKDEALFVGSLNGNRLDLLVPATGTYRIDVYLMRNAARRNEQARYALRMR